MESWFVIPKFLQLFYNVQIGVLWCGGFLHSMDRGVSLCKLSREYFLLWAIKTSLYGNINTSTLPVVQTKLRVTNRCITNETWLFETWLNHYWCVTRLSLSGNTNKCFNQHFRFVQTKQRMTNCYITNKTWLFETWLNRIWRVARLSVTLLTKIFQQ